MRWAADAFLRARRSRCGGCACCHVARCCPCWAHPCTPRSQARRRVRLVQTCRHASVVKQWCCSGGRAGPRLCGPWLSPPKHCEAHTSMVLRRRCLTRARGWRQSLSKLRELPPSAWVFCGHEYTQSNAKFASKVDPDNAVLAARAAEIKELRAQARGPARSALFCVQASRSWLCCCRESLSKRAQCACNRTPRSALPCTGLLC